MYNKVSYVLLFIVLPIVMIAGDVIITDITFINNKVIGGNIVDYEKDKIYFAVNDTLYIFEARVAKNIMDERENNLSEDYLSNYKFPYINWNSFKEDIEINSYNLDKLPKSTQKKDSNNTEMEKIDKNITKSINTSYKVSAPNIKFSIFLISGCISYNNFSTDFDLEEGLEDITLNDETSNKIKNQITRHKTIGYICAGVSILNLFTLNSNLNLQSNFNRINLIYKF